MDLALDIDRVEWLPASSQAVRVEVRGQMPIAAGFEPPVLLVDDGRQRHPFAAELTEAAVTTADAPPAGTKAWTAVFSVPIEMRPFLERRLAMMVGTREIALPAATPGAARQAATAQEEPAEVIDHAVLAERRARRAELGEQTSSQRAGEAEATARSLGEQIEKLEARLSDIVSERDRLEQQLAEREDELRRSKQHEYAEQQRHVEAQERQAEELRSARATEAELRTVLADAEHDLERLGAELERLRSRYEQAQRSRAAEREALTTRAAELEQRERGLADAEAELERRLESVRGAEAQAHLLRDELDRRRRLHARMQDELDGLGAELAALRKAARGPEAGSATPAPAAAPAADRRELERRLAALRDELRSQLAEHRELLTAEVEHVEQAVTALSAQLREAAGALAEREHELARLREAVRAADGARERERDLRALVGNLAEAAAEVRERLDTELQELRDGLETGLAQQQAAHARELATLQQRVVDLRRELVEATRELQLRGEPGRGGPAAPATPASSTTQPPAPPRPARDGPTGPVGQAASTLAGPGRSVPPAGSPQSCVIDDLDDAVRRLRERVASAGKGVAVPPIAATPAPPQPSPPDQPEPEPSAAVTPTPPPEPEPTPPRAPEPTRPPTAPTEHEPTPTPIAQARPEPTPFVPRLVKEAASRKAHPWLAKAIRRVAEQRDPKLAAELLLELLAAQALVYERELSYGLTVVEREPVRVRLANGSVRLDKLSDAGEKLEFTLSGPVQALAPLAAGGGSKRLPGAEVEGNKRALRKLLKKRRPPVTLAQLADNGIRVWPGLLLLALAEAVDPAWTAGDNFTIAFAITGPPSASLYVSAAAGQPLAIADSAPPAREITTVELSEMAFLALMGGALLPPGERLLVSGSSDPLERLLALTDRAQGLT